MSKHRPLCRLKLGQLFLAFVLLLFSSTAWSPARADFQGPLRDNLSLPDRNAKSAGFQINLSFEDQRLFGDVATTIQVVPSGGSFPARRTITVRVGPAARTTQPQGGDAYYDLPLELPEGAGDVTKQFYLPKWSVGGSLEVSVLEDRRLIEGYQGRVSGPAFYPGQAEAAWWESAEQRFGWIYDAQEPLPDARLFFATVAPELLNVRDIEAKPTGFEFADTWRQFRALSTDELATDWRGFDVAEVWVIESKLLRKWMSTKSAATSALRDYLRCGGTLWVLGATTQDEMSDWFELVPHEDLKAKELVRDVVRAASSAVDYEVYRANAYQPNMTSRNYIREYAIAQVTGGFRRPNPGGQNALAVDIQFDKNLAWYRVKELEGGQQSAQPEAFRMHRLALGRILCCNLPDAVPGAPQQWRTLVGLTESEISETLRRAVDPCFGDRRFWDWIIPNVAQPPVYTFIGLLTVFVIVVGPLAYRKFTKLGRGYLMMFVAPLLALVTTLVMFAYGLVADGLSTTARVREVTWVGDQSGAAARYCRATYFAGVRPSEGMRVPSNAVLLPYQLPDVSSWFEASQLDRSMVGGIRIEDDWMRLDSGFLPSRRQKQFVTYRPVADVGLVRLDGTDDPASARFKSGIGFDLRQGIARDADGTYYRFDELPANSEVRAIAVPNKSAGELLSDLYAVQRPLAPPAVSSNRRTGDTLIDMVLALGTRPSQRQILTSRSASGESAVEAWLRMTLQIDSELPKGMFIAIADVTPDCIAVEGAELVESVHYVLGVLP
jgi:hypothetical protein